MKVKPMISSQSPANEAMLFNPLIPLGRDYFSNIAAAWQYDMPLFSVMDAYWPKMGVINPEVRGAGS